MEEDDGGLEQSMKELHIQVKETEDHWREKMNHTHTPPQTRVMGEEVLTWAFA
jgi:hypothetical protein